MADTNRDADTLKEDKEAFEMAEEAEADNRTAYEEDVRFARLEEQWPSEIVAQRKLDHRPCLTINKLGAHIKQVVNDARQNKPSIKVHPQDGGADKETADIISGLIRNIEATSSADIAYDWGAECAVSGGFGYLRIVDEYAHDDAFDMDLMIKRVLDPLSVYGDPHATSADGSDWNSAFIVERMRKDDFAKKYKGAEPINWDALGYIPSLGEWFTENEVMVAERWIREEVDRPICLLSNGTVINKEALEEQIDGAPYSEWLALQGVTIVRERVAKTMRVKQRILTGAEVLSETEWKGRYIPIVPVYGEEIFVDGKRHFRSLIRSAKDAQRQFNYWETNATEMVALQPRTPFIGAKGSFKTHPEKWSSINTRNHSYVEYDIVAGAPPPQRQPIDMGPAAASLTEAARASDNIKATIGMYDASLGAKSNETSGKAIMARQREGDVSTFHFADNMQRSIRHAGRILIDLIPHYYNKERIIRVLGEDGTPRQVPIKQPAPIMGPDGQPRMSEGPNGEQMRMTRIYDLGAGKYDLTVTSGPSYTTRREEAATQMTEMVRAYPDLMPVVGDLIAKNLDWPGGDEIAERLKALVPDKAKGGLPPELQKQMKEAEEKFKALEAENAQLKAAMAGKQAEVGVKQGELEVKQREADTDAYRAETERMVALRPPAPPMEHKPMMMRQQ